MNHILTEADKKMAEEFGAVFDVKTLIDNSKTSIVIFPDELAALLAKVREDERERCAKECDALADSTLIGKTDNYPGEYTDAGGYYAECAEQIRILK